MKLYLITPPQTGRDELSLVLHFLERGLHKLHIRKPGCHEDDLRQYILSIPSPFHSRLVVHGAPALAGEFPAAGIHLRSSDRQNEALMARVRQMRPASLSTSFHAWEEIMENTTPYDYVFISPLFDSISKQGYRAAIDPAGLARLTQWASAHKKQLPGIVALGGINASTLAQVSQYGFEGAALLGAIWESADPIASYEAMGSVGSH